MKDNLFSRVASGISGGWQWIKGGVRKATDSLTPRQRLTLIVSLFLVFAVADVCYIVKGFREGATKQIEVEHMKALEIEAINTFEDDTEPEGGESGTAEGRDSLHGEQEAGQD